jgi:DNA-binding CsgD family transcriptional regulator
MQLLTSREHQIARLVASGSSNQEIAARLKISEQTVKNHVQSIFRKLALANRVELALHIARNRRSAFKKRKARRLKAGLLRYRGTSSARRLRR